MEDITVSIIDTSSSKYQAVWQLREEVLRQPLGLSLKNEDLSQDHKDIIFIAEKESEVIGCLILQNKGVGEAKLRQMAVASRFQGIGVGRRLMTFAEHYIVVNGYRIITLHARKNAMKFYEKLKYIPSGNEFMEVGIPHFLMQKPI